MQDPFGRKIDYLRISVTDRCNLRCYYCMTDRCPELLERKELLSYEEIADFARTAVDLGITKIRLTGGEPLMRSGIVYLVSMLRQLDGLDELCMTTNGVLLDKYAAPLIEAGLDRINVSLDTVDPESYRKKTQGGNLDKALSGIQAALDAGFEHIKLNCVVERSSEERDARTVAAFGEQHGFEVRFIRHMNLAQGEFWVVDGGTGGQCESCNRIRLSSDGLVRPCLFSDAGFSVRELGAKEAILRAIEHKPESGEKCHTTTFRRIGG